MKRKKSDKIKLTMTIVPEDLSIMISNQSDKTIEVESNMGQVSVVHPASTLLVRFYTHVEHGAIGE